MRKQRISALLLCAALLLCGCAGEAPSPTAAPEATAEAERLPAPPTPPPFPEPSEDKSEEDSGYPMQAEVSVTRGEVEDGVYRNPSLGLCFTAPEGWSLAPTEYISYLNGISDPDLPDWLQDFVSDGSSISQELMQYVLALYGKFTEMYGRYQDGVGNVGIVYDLPEGLNTLDEQEFFETQGPEMLRSLEQTALEEVSLELETIELAGSPHVCAVVHGHAGDLELHQLNFCLLREDVWVNVVITALDEQILEQALAGFTALDEA